MLRVYITALVVISGAHQLDETLRLAPLTTPVQRGTSASENERDAFAELTSRSRGDALKVRIAGPLRARSAPRTPPILEVRIFHFPGRTQNQTKL